MNITPACSLYDYLFTLAEDVIEQRVSAQFLSLSFLSKPVKFMDAPEDEMLMILGDHLTGCFDLDTNKHNFGLLKGSLVSKMSREMRAMLHVDEFYRIKKFESLLTIERAFVRVRAPKTVNKIDIVSQKVYKYGTDISNCYVIPINQVLSNGKPLFKSFAFYSEQDKEVEQLVLAK